MDSVAVSRTEPGYLAFAAEEMTVELLSGQLGARSVATAVPGGGRYCFTWHSTDTALRPDPVE